MALKSAPRVLTSFGVDPERVAQRAGLDLRVLAHPEERIPFALLGRFLAESVRATRCEHFGLLVGVEQGFGALGIVGHLMQHSQDVRTALQTLSSYLHHQEIGGVATLSVERGIASLDYSIEVPDLEAADQITDAALGIGVSLMRFLGGATWTPRDVQVTHARPRDIAAYRRALAAPVHFGAERNALRFDAHWLDQRIESADPVMRRILERKITELEADTRADLPSRVRGLLRAMLLAGETSSEDAARRLAVTRRTLHRRLDAYGVTYEQLLDAMRYELAQQLLQHSAASMTEITVALNYANGAAFTRAFRRWSGSTPSAWRRQRRGVAP